MCRTFLFLTAHRVLSLNHHFHHRNTLSKMKLSKALAAATDLRISFQIAFLPTLRAILKNPNLLLHPSRISREFMSHVWVEFGKGIDENTRGLKTSFITPNAYGVVLDIGAGVYLCH